MTTRVCLECGAEFMPRSGSQVCCSDKCRKARHRRTDRECRRRARGADFDRSPRVCLECGAAFEPRRKNQICCSDECKAARKKMLVANRNQFRDQKHEKAFRKERREQARRRAEFFAARDAAFEKAGQPIPKIVVRNGVRVENRGTCVGVAGFNPTFPILPKSY